VNLAKVGFFVCLLVWLDFPWAISLAVVLTLSYRYFVAWCYDL